MSSQNRERIWVCIESTNPQFKPGDTIIPSKKDKLNQQFLNIKTGKETHVKWKFIGYRDELNNPERKKEMIAFAEKVASGKVEQ
ncbi:hypothetical protein ACNF40_06545 [Cuniculiplasma sp. SKW4]|uniref:hypothetical protein n=1 Tax=Cuniculiplasma sp. SKW4 TaxID=3400171 RepID=UPI003FD504FF